MKNWTITNAINYLASNDVFPKLNHGERELLARADWANCGQGDLTYYGDDRSESDYTRVVALAKKYGFVE